MALCSPVLPDSGTAAQLAARWLPAMGSGLVFVENPYRVQPGQAPEDAIQPLADLPHRCAAEKGILPVYLIGDDPLHACYLPYVLRCPGIVVFTDGSLGALRQSLDVPLPGIGGHGSFLPELAEKLSAGTDLVTILARSAVRAFAADDAVAAALRSHELPVLPDDAGAAVAELLQVESSAAPRDESIAWPAVAAVVVSYNSKGIIGPCLQSLVDQDYPALEIIVVDNDSQDGTPAFVRERFPSVRLIESGANLGFAGGNNLAFRSSDAKYFVLLNQDAIARRSFVAELVRVAELHDNIASVGAKMLMSRCPTLLNSAGTEINEGGVGADRLVGEKDEDRSFAPVEVFGSSGGAVLMRRSAIEHVGGFDEKFFMYYEDTDLCWRFLIAGYRNYYAPLATVLHDFHDDPDADPGRQFRRRFMSERNRLQTLRKNMDSQWLREVMPKVRKNERERLAWIKDRLREAENDELRGIAAMIRKAWRWNATHLPSIWLRRRRVQSLRKGPVEEIRRLFVPGVKESGHQGDIMAFRDRFSAEPQQEIVIGESDKACLGTGWHVVERPPDADAAHRWCKGRAWFYLQPESQHTGVVLRAASPIEPHAMKLFVEDQEIATQTVAEAQEVVATIPEDLRTGRLLEFRIETESLRPVDRDLGPDYRELGLVVFRMGLTND